MFTIRAEIPGDSSAREILLDRAFGTERWRKTSERLREGQTPAEGLAFSAIDDQGGLAGTLRLWNIVCGSAGPALLLGPLAVEASARGHGLGARLMHHALEQARAQGHRAILLVGDLPYYQRFGFTQVKPDQGLFLPGPVDSARFLFLELTPGALGEARGLVRPGTPKRVGKPRRRAA